MSRQENAVGSPAFVLDGARDHLKDMKRNFFLGNIPESMVKLAEQRLAFFEIKYIGHL